MHQVPILQVQHKDTNDWVVAAKWPSGHIEEVGTFETEAEASEWVAKELQSWLNAEGRKDQGYDRTH